jgi:hypothetical protein
LPIECWLEGGDVYDRAALGGYDRMRVSTDKTSGSDGRLFTVVVESYGVGQQRQAERRFTVSFDRLQSLMQSIARNGGTQPEARRAPPDRTCSIQRQARRTLREPR